MEGTFIFIVMFAGAAIALLAIFLVASEKELTKKRLEIDQLLAKLGDATISDSATVPSAMAAGGSNEELEALRARNQELEKELESVSTKLASGDDTNEEVELAKRDVEIAKSNAQWLQDANDELKAEVESLKQRLNTHETGNGGFAPQSFAPTSDRQAALEREIANLQERLAASQSKLHALESMEQKIASIDMAESENREAKHVLEARITELENALAAASANQTNEAESLRQRLAEAEQIHQTLRDERQGFVREIGRWQAQAAQAEEQGRWLKALQESFALLLDKQGALDDRQREYQEALANFSQLIAAANGASQSAPGFNEFNASASAAQPKHPSTATVMRDADGATTAVKQVIAAAHVAQKPKRLFGLLPVIILVVSVTALVGGLWSRKATDTTPTVTASALPPSNQEQVPTPPIDTGKPEPIINEPTSPAEIPPARETAKPVAQSKVAAAKPIPAVQIQQPVAGTYEITHPSRVYAGPTELSQAMGDIEPGVRVNVVGAKNGWLEIHSKHGRPPGFIRKEGARVLARN